MIKKIKQTISEKILLTFLILLGIGFFGSYGLIKNKCLFVKKYDPQKLKFEKRENIAILNVPCGNVIIELDPNVAPNSVKRFKILIRSGEYNNVAFHRVIDGFMAQTGDVKFGNSSSNNFNLSMAGTGGSDLPNLKAEFSDVPHLRGTLSMARSSDPDSANSQFFICFEPAPHLDRNYTVFGKVIEGMELVDQIKRGDGGNGAVSDPDKILSFKSM